MVVGAHPVWPIGIQCNCICEKKKYTEEKRDCGANCMAGANYDKHCNERRRVQSPNLIRCVQTKC